MRGRGVSAASRSRTASGGKTSGPRAVAPGAPQGEHHLPVGAAVQALLCERRAQHVLHAVLAAALVERTQAHVAAQVEAILVSLARAPCGDGPRFLIRDNDDTFGRGFDAVAAGTDIAIPRTPVQASSTNAVSERFLRSTCGPPFGATALTSTGHNSPMCSQLL